MNNMLRYIVYILLFLLFTITVGQDYHTVETTDLPPQTSCYPVSYTHLTLPTILRV